MVQFSEGARWTVYGQGGFEDKASMTFDIGDTSATSVIRFNKGFVAMSMLTGGVLSNIVELDMAVAVAENEALNPAHA
jgi:hypothetical protein